MCLRVFRLLCLPDNIHFLRGFRGNQYIHRNHYVYAHSVDGDMCFQYIHHLHGCESNRYVYAHGVDGDALLPPPKDIKVWGVLRL